MFLEITSRGLLPTERGKEYLHFKISENNRTEKGSFKYPSELEYQLSHKPDPIILEQLN